MDPPTYNKRPHITCGGCTTTWTGLAMCHCSECHETFGGFKSFGRHRSEGKCRHPITIGLRRNDDRACWSEPYSWQRPNAVDPIGAIVRAYATTITEPADDVTAMADSVDTFYTKTPPPLPDGVTDTNADPRSKDW